MIDTDTSEVIDITGFRETDDGVDQDVGLARSCSTNSQLSVCPVHWVPGLEGHDAAPAQLLKMCTKLSGSEPESHVVVMAETIDRLQLTTNIVFLRLLVQVFDSWVLRVAAKDILSLLFLIRLVDIVDSQDGQIVVVSEISQSELRPSLELASVHGLLVNVQADWHAEEGAISKPGI